MGGREVTGVTGNTGEHRGAHSAHVTFETKKIENKPKKKQKNTFLFYKNRKICINQ
jgi:hypothetical protein